MRLRQATTTKTISDLLAFTVLSGSVNCSIDFHFPPQRGEKNPRMIKSLK